MSSRSFEDLRSEVFRLYLEKRYDDALELVEAEASSHPAEEISTAYWRACLASVSGRRDDALRIIRDVLDRGGWFSLSQLRDDSDFEGLQGDREFEALVDACRARNAEAQAKARPQLVTVEPSTPQPWPLLVALHGNTKTAADSLEHWRPAVEAGWLLALPQSSQVGGPRGFVWDDREWAAREIKEHLAALASKYRTSGTVVGGFSAGGALAPWLVVTGVVEADAFIAVGPGHRNPVDWGSLVGESDVRGHVIVGEKDALCLQTAGEIAGALNARGQPCGLEVIPGLGHEFPEDFPARLGRALTSLTA
jgi:predicted esterase